ncbi:MAG: nitroreductase family protein [Pseudomonadota bacterium]
MSATPAALDFLLARRSRPYKLLSGPVPDREALNTLLTAAARTPDHGKLEPWRFIVLSEAAMHRLATLAVEIGEKTGKDPDSIEKMRFQLAAAPLAVAVVESPKPSQKIPAIEQTYSAGAACLGLLNAALAAGWGANWLSGWASHDQTFCAEGLGLSPEERLVGFVHIGTASATPPERPRPDLDAITTWVDG